MARALSQASGFAGVSREGQADDAIAAARLARELTRRVPFEPKAVLAAVSEAIELAQERMPREGRGGERGLSCGGQGEDGLVPGEPWPDLRRVPPLAALMLASRAASASTLLPLPLPAPSIVPPSGRDKGCTAKTPGGFQGAGGGDGKRVVGQEQHAAEAARATAEMLLDAFVQSPGAVMRAVRRALQRG